VIGPVAAGVLIDHGSFVVSLVVSAVVVAACTLPGLRVPRVPVG
jgi:cyanate permease